MVGEQLEQMCRSAEQSLVLVAPFIKIAVLRRLLADVPEKVTVQVITRWRPEEILSGVSDIEIWPELRERPDASLWLRPDLHAKYYRADHVCLVGSANITASALGWNRNSNFELLIEMSALEPTLRQFEAELLCRTVRVDDALYEQMALTVSLLAEQYPNLPPTSGYETRDAEVEGDYGVHRPDQQQVEQWLPQLRDPAALFLAYSGEIDQLTISERSAALHDLLVLDVAPDLSRAAFKASVGSLLLQQPLIRRVDDFLDQPRRFGAVRDFLAKNQEAISAGSDPTLIWQTLMRWLLYFLPDRYEQLPSRHSEVLQRVRRPRSSDNLLRQLSYEVKFKRLRRSAKPGSWSESTHSAAPHKPLLLLSVLDLVEDGTISINFIAPDPALQTKFDYYFHLVMGSERQSIMAFPFQWLEGDGFWHLEPAPGHNRTMESKQRIGTNEMLREVVRGARLDAALFELLQEADVRERLRRVLLDTYFSTEVADQLRLSRPQRSGPRSEV